MTKGGSLLYTDTYLYTDADAPYELLRTSASGATSRYWYEMDGRGNVVALTDINGKVVDRYAYDSWGELTSDDATNETVPQQLRYAGYWYDEKLSWYWLSVRYYDPEIERFLQPDPSEQNGVRTYAYVDDNPIDAIDPTGCCRIDVYFKPVKHLHLGFIDITPYWHAYVVTTDSTGQYFFRGGPACGTGVGGSGISNSGKRNYGSSNSGNCNIGSSNSGNNNIGSSNSGSRHRGVGNSGGGFFGYIETEHNHYLLGSTDYPTGSDDPRRIMPIYNDGRACQYWNDRFAAVLARIDAAHIDYHTAGPNSNTVAKQTLIGGGLGQYTPNDTVVGAPGWNSSIDWGATIKVAE